ncbi:MAG: twin-arginine translocase subunit TatC [Mariniblastus sp.]|nr:twin-arginine translocase subunit TatC [Mariniblastus sp.]
MNFRETNEDLFEQSRMSFGDHLEELRKVLIKALYGVAIGCVFGFWFASDVVEILVQPLADAIEEYDSYDAEQQLIEKYGYIPPEYLHLIHRENVAPKLVQVDPTQFLLMLQDLVPDLGTSIPVQHYSFRKSHFQDGKLKSFCQRLSTQTSSDAGALAKLKAIWAELPPVDQATITRIAKVTGEGSDSDLSAVLQVLNRLASNAKLYEAEAFQVDLVEGASGFLATLSPEKPRPLASIKAKLDEEFDLSLNRRLNRSLITSEFPDQLNPLIVDLVSVEIWESTKFKPQALGVGEGFGVWLKAGLFTGLTIAGPWVFFQLWAFVAAGLYPHEKKHIHVFLPISIVLFGAGVLLAFFFVFQPVLGFLFSFNRSMGIAPEMRINEWLSFVMFLPLGFGIAFQLPLVMLFMNRIGLFQVEDYLKKWRVAVMIIFVLAMFLTPADPISMLLLAVPLSILYFTGIAMCKWMPRSENPFGDDAAVT